MFDKPPRILAHNSVLRKGNYAAGEYILTNNGLMKRFCPHRMYPIQEIGTFSTDNLICNFHGFEWDQTGRPINNDRKLNCGSIEPSASGLIFKNFIEPNHKWVDDLSKETDLEYSHCIQGNSKGSWLWMMDIQADLLHIRSGENTVHPELSSITNINDTELTQGENWALQTCSTGWWLCIYPYTFIEWSPGCLAINYTMPYNTDDEFKFDWISQFYYNPSVNRERRENFEKYFHDVFLEDIQAIEKQKGGYFPLKNPISRLEDHCLHYGQWFEQNLRNIK